MKKFIALLMMTVMCAFCLTGCIKPYDTPEFVTIEASQTAFLVPLVGDTSDQAAFASEQDLEIQENKNAANIAKAEAEARAIIIEAEAQAEANRLLSQSLTDEIIAKMYYEKWDGVLPSVYGANDTLLQVPTN